MYAKRLCLWIIHSVSNSWPFGWSNSLREVVGSIFVRRPLFECYAFFAYTSCVIPESIMTNEYISLWKVLFIEWIIHECHFCLLRHDSSCDVSHSKNILKYTWAPSCLRMYLQILPWIFNAWILFTFYANVLLCLQEKCQVEKCVLFKNIFS